MRNVRAKRTLAVVLAAMMLIGVLSGCGKKAGESGGDSEIGTSEYVYVPTYTAMDEAIDNMGNLCCAADTIYFTQNLPQHADGTPVTQTELDEMNKYYEDKYSDASVDNVNVGADSISVTSEPVTSDQQIMEEEEKEFDIEYVTGIYSVKTDGTGYTKLPDYVAPKAPEGDNSYSNIDRISVDGEGNLWIAESTSKTIFNLPEGFDESTGDMWEYYDHDETTNTIRKLSPTGAELASLDLSQYIEKPEGEEAQYYSFYVGDMVADGKGNIVINDGNQTAYVISSTGEFLFKLTVDGWLSSFVKLTDGTVCASTSGNTGDMVLMPIDVNTKAWGAEKKMPSDAWRTSSGGSLYDFCYSDSSSLYGYDIETETETKILTWLNCDVDGDNLEYSTVLDNGDVFVISRDWNDDDGKSSYEVVTLVKTPRSEVKQKTVLTMATMWLDYSVRGKILEFNKTNPDYRIEIQDYSEYNTDEDYTAGMTKLNTEIISGKVPDIIDVSQLPYQQYAAKGLLEDLYPYIDSDPDFGKEDFVQSILKAAETDGKLYQIMSGFSVMSIIASPEVAGSEMGWTMAEMQDIINQHPNADMPLGMYISRDSILQNFCTMNMSDYMDWQTGECSFNSDEFKNLLTFANSFPDQETMQQQYSDDSEWKEPAVLIAEGHQLFDLFSASDFDSFQYYKAQFGGNVVFKGLPCSDRSGNVAYFNGGLAMTTSCKDKDGAWQFMRSLLDEDTQKDQWYFPIMQKAYDAKLAEAMKQEYTTDENGNKIPVSHGGMSYGNGETVEFYAITQEEADQFNAMIDSVTRCMSNDTGITNIISEEAAAYFAGEKTVDQTADIIQSRMNIYINEQR